MASALPEARVFLFGLLFCLASLRVQECVADTLSEEFAEAKAEGHANVIHGHQLSETKPFLLVGEVLGGMDESTLNLMSLFQLANRFGYQMVEPFISPSNHEAPVSGFRHAVHDKAFSHFFDQDVVMSCWPRMSFVPFKYFVDDMETRKPPTQVSLELTVVSFLFPTDTSVWAKEVRKRGGISTVAKYSSVIEDQLARIVDDSEKLLSVPFEITKRYMAVAGKGPCTIKTNVGPLEGNCGDLLFKYTLAREKAVLLLTWPGVDGAAHALPAGQVAHAPPGIHPGFMSHDGDDFPCCGDMVVYGLLDAQQQSVRGQCLRFQQDIYDFVDDIVLKHMSRPFIGVHVFSKQIRHAMRARHKYMDESLLQSCFDEIAEALRARWSSNGHRPIYMASDSIMGVQSNRLMEEPWLQSLRAVGITTNEDLLAYHREITPETLDLIMMVAADEFHVFGSMDTPYYRWIDQQRAAMNRIPLIDGLREAGSCAPEAWQQLVTGEYVRRDPSSEPTWIDMSRVPDVQPQRHEHVQTAESIPRGLSALKPQPQGRSGVALGGLMGRESLKAVQKAARAAPSVGQSNIFNGWWASTRPAPAGGKDPPLKPPTKVVPNKPIWKATIEPAGKAPHGKAPHGKAPHGKAPAKVSAKPPVRPRTRTPGQAPGRRLLAGR